MAKPVEKENIIGKYVEFYDKDSKYRVGKVKNVTGKRKIYVSVRLPLMSRNTKVPAEKIIGTVSRSGMRRMIIWKEN